MGKGTIQDDTFISAFLNVGEWKRNRESLIQGVPWDTNEESEWDAAFRLLNIRITTRFLDPINWILEKQLNRGEGFSIVALQCILIEFLEAFYQGKIFTTSKTPGEFEYNSSKKLFCDFLMKHKPFSDYFTDKSKASGFFDNVRCGLLHEAATKETSRINNAPQHDFLVMFEPGDSSNMRVYRENFYSAILQFIEQYRVALLTDKKLQTNFIRKIDDICGIRHKYYFAYGSNMFPERLMERIRKYHTAFRANILGHRFVYNKKSIDGSAKANIEKAEGTTAAGVCFEVDEDDLAALQKYEDGYDRRNVTVKTDDGTEVKAVTYISASVDDTLKPSEEYKNLVLKGANHWALEASYIANYLG